MPSAFDPKNPLSGSSKRTLFTFVLFFSVIFYFIFRFSGGTDFLNVLKAISPGILLLMIFVQVLYIFLQAKLLQIVYASVGLERSFIYLVFTWLSMNLINTIAPLLGVSGILYIMYFEKKRNVERSKMLLIAFLYYVLYYVMFLTVLLTGALYLYIDGELSRPLIVTGISFVLFVLAFLLGGSILFTHETALLNTMMSIRRVMRKFIPNNKLYSTEKIKTFALESKSAWNMSRTGIGRLWWGIIPSFSLHVVSLLLLVLSLKSISAVVNLQQLVAGYTVGTLLNIVSITPGGIGFAEGGMTATFLALNLPIEQSLVATLLYRGVFIGVPLLLGGLAIHFYPRISGNSSLQ